MGVKESIWGSRSEERGFRSIEHIWGDEYRIFPQFPFSALFNSDDSIRNTANFFFKTNIDYLLSTKSGKPLLAIDFDGLGKGFGRDGKYVPVEVTSDPNRKVKFDFKLSYARKSGFPYHVVSYKEFQPVGVGIELTVTDGIIGSELAKRDFHDRIPSVIEEDRDYIECLRPNDRHEYIQDLVTGQEIESDYAFNPIVKRTAEIKDDIRTIAGSLPRSENFRSYEEPELPEVVWPGLVGLRGCLKSVEVS